MKAPGYGSCEHAVETSGKTAIVPGHNREYCVSEEASCDDRKVPSVVAVSAVDRIGRESPITVASPHLD